jgi:hypothetical protein
VEAGVTDVQFPLPYFASNPSHASALLPQVVDSWRNCLATHDRSKP